MSGIYARLGLDTVSQRFTRGLERAGIQLGSAMRALETAVVTLNLDADAVHLAAELAALEPDLDDDARFALIILIVISLAALQEGNTRFPVSGAQAEEPMNRMLGALFSDSPDGPRRNQIAADIAAILKPGAAESVIGRDPTARRPLLYLAPFIYHQRVHACESRLAVRLAALLAAQADGDTVDAKRLDAALNDISTRPATIGGARVTLSQEQRHAVEIAASSRLAVISGGPGTGKTSIVVAILRVLARLGFDPRSVALTAPTGKAAYRMRESIAAGLGSVARPSREDDALREAALDPSTIHRLLGYSPDRGTFRHHRNNPLAARVVIVDEGSMLDLTLMERLAGAIADDARLVILGDANQLPSVAAGAVFRDLVPRDRSPLAGSLGPYCVELHHSYRTASHDTDGAAILDTAGRINAGQTDLLTRADSPVRLRATAKDIEFRGVEFVSGTPAGLGDFLTRWHDVQISGDDEIARLIARDYAYGASGFNDSGADAIARLFEHRARSRILCVTRVGMTGAEAINQRMHRRALDDADGGRTRRAMIAGEPVMILRNDYEHSLFNGDQGVLVNLHAADGRRSLAAVFPRGAGFVPFGVELLRDRLELCYAMTVHKAQGSEFDTTAIVLPERDLPLLSREILYTAVSRSRRSAVVFGDAKLAAAAIAKKIDRYSGLSEALAAQIKPKASSRSPRAKPK